MAQFVDLNCDLGEIESDAGFEQDRALIAVISSANVACGQHAGSESRMRQLARLCREHSVAFGAHPGYADREHFGRRHVVLTANQLKELILLQLGLAAEVAAGEGIALAHVKPHGAMYNLAASDPEIAKIIVETVRGFSKRLALFALSGGCLESIGRASGLQVVSEAFPDRAYDTQGRLVDRAIPEAVIHDPDIVARRAIQMVTNQSVKSISGSPCSLQVATLCVHGDSPAARQVANAVHAALVQNGISICAPGKR
jgi:UPF0271 protein